jgi:F0F1-type ATP synthase membrane subunit b/b'
MGEREYNGEVKALDVPAIIDRETWEMAQATIRTQEHQPRSTYTLSGLLTCTCGTIMQRVRIWQGGQANGQADWRCPECGLSIREHIVEPAVVGQFFDHLDPARYKAALTEAQKNVKKGQGRAATLTRRLAALERKQSRLLNEFVKDDSTVTRAAYNKANAALQREIDELTAALQQIEDKALLTLRPRALGNIREDWNTLDVADKQATLRDFVARVTVVSQNGLRGADRVSISWRV